MFGVILEIVYFLIYDYRSQFYKISKEVWFFSHNWNISSC